jgi:hypothetical protein
MVGGRFGAIVGGFLAIALLYFLPVFFLSHVNETDAKVAVLAMSTILLAGALLLTWAWLRFLVRDGYETRAACTHPYEPWSWRRDWAEGEVRASVALLGRLALFFALLGDILAVLLVSFLIDGSKLSEKARQLAAVRYGIAAIVIALAAYILIKAVRWFRATSFMEAAIKLGSVPLYSGIPFPSFIELDPAMRFDGPISVAIGCYETTRICDNRHTDTLWEEELQAVQQGTTIRLEPRAVPDGLPAATIGASSPEVRWSLSVVGSVSGRDLSLSFDLPVFHKGTIVGENAVAASIR